MKDRLKNKKRMGFSLPFDTVEWLQKYSKKTGIPMTTIVDRAIKEYKDKT